MPSVSLLSYIFAWVDKGLGVGLSPVYGGVGGEMLRVGVKMEQEVVSVFLGEEGVGSGM